MILSDNLQLYWADLIPETWSGPILLRSAEYLKSLQHLLSRHPTRVIHNSLLVAFALTILPPETPNTFVCTKATMWAMPEISSALYVAQFSDEVTNDVISRVWQTFMQKKKKKLKFELIFFVITARRI